jgi:arabinogalactan endo-1,4-beta-galactosidase
MGMKFANPVPAAAVLFPNCGSAVAGFMNGTKKAGVLAGLLLGTTFAAPAAPFVAGADFSHLAFFEARGVTYKDGGQVQDGIQILKNHGINCVRLRLFTSSAAQASANPYNYINNTTYTVPLAVRVKNAGLLFCLDFHYSDTWADPGNQTTPAAWASLTFAQLKQQMRTYNSNAIAAFAAAGAMPDYVQVGNEITPGMLWPLGQVDAYVNGGTQWSQLGQLMTNAIQGIRDAAGANMPKIIVHIDRGGDWTTTMKYFDNLIAQGVSFDIIGESYYPWWHGSPTSLNICLSNAAVRYGKPIIVAETAFPWTNTFPTSWTNFGSLYGFPPTRDGQVSFIAALAKVVKSVPNQLGAGVFYWGTEYQAVSGVNEAGFNTASFFDAGGNVLPVADAVGGMAAPLLIRFSLNGSNLQLQWPFSGAASKLMTSTTLAPSTAWSSVPDPIQTTGAVFAVTLPVDSSLTRFYRLQSN